LKLLSVKKTGVTLQILISAEHHSFTLACWLLLFL